MIGKVLKATFVAAVVAQPVAWYNGANDAIRAREAAQEHGTDFNSEYERIEASSSWKQTILNNAGIVGYAVGFEKGRNAIAPEPGRPS